MGYGVTPIAVSFAKVESVIGKPQNRLWGWFFGTSNEPLIADLKQRFAYRFDHDEVDEDDEDEPTLETALRNLLQGQLLPHGYGHKYGYALEILCRHFGETLDDSEWSAMRWEWVEQVQQAMNQIGIDEKLISTHHLLTRGSPIPIPSPDDFPSIGYLRKTEITAALQSFQAADLAGLDEELARSIRQIADWLKTCQRKNCDLICFYY